MPDNVKPVTHTGITADLVRKQKRHVGGASDNTKVPLADPGNRSTSPVVYGADVVATLVSTGIWVAFGVEGESYPRMLVDGSGTGARIYLGSGDIDPAGGSNLAGGTDGVSGARYVRIASQYHSFAIDDQQFDYPTTSNVESAASLDVPLKLQGAYSNSPFLNAYNGNPNGALAGDVGDWCFTKNTAAGTRIYQCTTGGDASTAVWTGRV